MMCLPAMYLINIDPLKIETRLSDRGKRRESERKFTHCPQGVGSAPHHH
jgi:hypothetical protein